MRLICTEVKEVTVYIAGKCGAKQPDELIDQLAACFEDLGFHLLDWRSLPVEKPYLEHKQDNANAAKHMIDWAMSCDAFVLLGHDQNYMAHIELGAALASIESKPIKYIFVLLEAGVRESLAYCHPSVILVRSVAELGKKLQEFAEIRAMDSDTLKHNLAVLYQKYGQQLTEIERQAKQAGY